MITNQEKNPIDVATKSISITNHIQSNFSVVCDIVLLIVILVIAICSLVPYSKLNFRLTIVIIWRNTTYTADNNLFFLGG